jgi:hypothetical protein
MRGLLLLLQSDTDTGRIFDNVCETGEACLYYSWQKLDADTEV